MRRFITKTKTWQQKQFIICGYNIIYCYCILPVYTFLNRNIPISPRLEDFTTDTVGRAWAAQSLAASDLNFSSWVFLLLSPLILFCLGSSRFFFSCSNSIFIIFVILDILLINVLLKDHWEQEVEIKMAIIIKGYGYDSMCCK